MKNYLFDLQLFATVSRNPDRRETYDHVLAGIPLVPGQAINEGDVTTWDNTLAAGNGALRVAVTQADMANFMGVSLQQSPIASLGDTINSIEIRRGGIVLMKTTPGETYKHFQPVYFNETLDAQTITNGTNAGARTVPVGFIQIPPELTMNGVATLLGAAGTNIDVWLKPNFPFPVV